MIEGITRRCFAIATWLACASALSAQEAAGVKSWPLQVPAAGKPGFTLMSPQNTGVLFTNELRFDAEATNQNLMNGSGLALGDYDGDGLCDIFLCNLNGSSRLYRNLGGWKFQDATQAAGLENTNQLARGATFADVDGDGRLDLLVTYSGKGALLFHNEGGGRFKDLRLPELVAETGSMSMALGDVNGDGALDLYICNYGENTIRSGMKLSTRMVNGKEQVVGRFRNRIRLIDGKLIEYGEPDAFYLNDGKGRFRQVSWTGGAFKNEQGQPLKEPPYELSFTVAIRDINGDGNPDIYVCNDFQDPDRLWLGDGKGGFRAAPRETIRSTPNFSMTVDFADINGDGLEDFFVTDMVSRFHTLRIRQLKPPSPPPDITREPSWDRPQVRRDFLYLNRGDGTYTDIGNYSGTANSDWTWSAAFIDVDLDGAPDILTGNGHYYDTQDQDGIERGKNLSPAERGDPRASLKMFPLLLTPNFAFHNQGNLTFREKGQAWGYDSRDVSHGLALADLDNDGDLDVVVNALRAPAQVYRNNCAAPRVSVRLKGLPPNTGGVGARLRFLGGPVPVQVQEMTCGSRFVSGDALTRTFAAKPGADMSLEITWRNGKRSIIKNIQANYGYEIDEAAAETPPSAPATPDPVAPLFEDVSADLNHQHQDPIFDDFSRQPLLPRRFSQLGPAVAWHDLNGDGRDDLVIGGGRGSTLGVFLNSEGGKWTRPAGFPTNALPDDSAGILAGISSGTNVSLLVGLASYETDAANPPSVLQFNSPLNQAVAVSLASLGISPGPMALADVDGDGDLDLFVGGRQKPGRYPEPANSFLLLNQNGQWVPDPAASKVLASLGLVTGAAFADLDGDGSPELLVACEWGPIRIFRMNKGQNKGQPVESKGQSVENKGQPVGWNPAITFSPDSISPPSCPTLAHLTGWWTCLATGDFNGDGRMDFVAGNWGQNSDFQMVAPGPWFLYYGDYNDDGAVQIFEAYYDAAEKKALPWRDLQYMEKALPWLRAKFPTHEAYSLADMPAILAEQKSRTNRLAVNFAASTLILNRGDWFEVSLLPPEAQWSPAMSMAVADFDGDGAEDVLLSQNFFAVRSEDARLDAGRGLILRGDGKGGFTPMTAAASGVRVYGEQRGCAVSDYDGDGRVDLVITQNRDQTRLLHNASAKSGVRVQLSGPPGNPDGVGAVVRLDYGGRLGPAREIQAGTGWSQNSAVQVLGCAETPKAVQVRWPGGKVTRTEIPAGQQSIRIDFNSVSR